MKPNIVVKTEDSIKINTKSLYSILGLIGLTIAISLTGYHNLSEQHQQWVNEFPVIRNFIAAFQKKVMDPVNIRLDEVKQTTEAEAQRILEEIQELYRQIRETLEVPEDGSTNIIRQMKDRIDALEDKEEYNDNDIKLSRENIRQNTAARLAIEQYITDLDDRLQRMANAIDSIAQQTQGLELDFSERSRRLDEIINDHIDGDHALTHTEIRRIIDNQIVRLNDIANHVLEKYETDINDRLESAHDRISEAIEHIKVNTSNIAANAAATGSALNEIKEWGESTVSVLDEAVVHIYQAESAISNTVVPVVNQYYDNRSVHVTMSSSKRKARRSSWESDDMTDKRINMNTDVAQSIDGAMNLRPRPGSPWANSVLIPSGTQYLLNTDLSMLPAQEGNNNNNVPAIEWRGIPDDDADL
jgi:hypothetical protein